MSEFVKRLKQAIKDPLWQSHNIGDEYTMDGKPERWKIAYYPVFENNETKEVYAEPRALIERPFVKNGKQGTDFREMPLRFLEKVEGDV